MAEDKKDYSVKTASLWDFVKALSTLGLVGVICYKIATAQLEMEFDFPTFLSVLLALFSVLLSALFYFKATDSSNKFYNNTYNFTKDISQLLAKIESGFGEKLRGLENNYSKVQDHLYNGSGGPFSQAERDRLETEKKDALEEKEKAEKKYQAEINTLIKNSKLDKKEKEKLKERLRILQNKIQNSDESLQKNYVKNLIKEAAVSSDGHGSSAIINKWGKDAIWHAILSDARANKFDNIYNEDCPKLIKSKKEKK
ncbi:MAG: hypothetical protein ACNI27_11060 [Desulfovibrio sp.]